jgi:hypothetical protein
MVYEAEPRRAHSAQQGKPHAAYICQQLGYRTIGNWDGTFGSVCGYNQPGASCSSPGSERMGMSAGPNCGSDANGGIYCNTVMWQCLR